MSHPPTDVADVLTSYASNFPEVIVCLSHLRWDFVYQRPQHLLSRFARDAKVYYIEEPILDDEQVHYSFTDKGNNITVVVPHLPPSSGPEEGILLQQILLDNLMAEMDMDTTALWYYTPMALKFSRHLEPALTVFDCMDELSAFKFAPQELKDLEAEVLEKADIVFTGGASLYKAKQHRHANIHLYASSIDQAHFRQARTALSAPDDQQTIPRPRLGFFGVIDERFDIKLIREIAELRPDWQLMLVGPVVKIDPATLPANPNIHYTGGRSYSELPAYLAGWDIAMIPFAINESTRFISPTKTPEYLAAGIPVISTPITDVVAPYGEQRLVHIAADAAGFVAAGETILAMAEADKAQWLQKVDRFLEGNSWDHTYASMQQNILATLAAKAIPVSIDKKPQTA